MKYFVLLITVLVATGCQRNLFDFGGAHEAKNKPRYDVQPNTNGGVSPIQADAAKK